MSSKILGRIYAVSSKILVIHISMYLPHLDLLDIDQNLFATTREFCTPGKCAVFSLHSNFADHHNSSRNCFCSFKSNDLPEFTIMATASLSVEIFIILPDNSLPHSLSDIIIAHSSKYILAPDSARFLGNCTENSACSTSLCVLHPPQNGTII